MRPETKRLSSGIDEGTGLPSGKVFLALAVLGLLLLLLAALTSDRVTSTPQRGPIAAKSVAVVPTAGRGPAQLSSPEW